jgi:WD40 associated region in TFIID subunit, NTD2 domain
MPAPTSVSGGVQRVQPASGGNPPSSGNTTAASSRGANQDWNAEDLQKVVLEYLTKKGYHKAETMLRLEASQMQEAANVGEGYRKLTDLFVGSSSDAYELLRDFVHQSLDIYKVEMARILWPTFAYIFMDLLAEGKDNSEKIDEGMLTHSILFRLLTLFSKGIFRETFRGA